MTPEELDTHLDAILRASGSALRHYSMQKTKDDMRAALKAALEASQSQALAWKEDAERLDWLQSMSRCDPKMDGQHMWWPLSWSLNHRCKGPAIRDAIDVARLSMKG